MLKKVQRFDSNSLYVEDVIIGSEDSIPPDCTDILMPEGIFLPAKFDGTKWETTLTQAQIDAIMNPVS